MNTEAAARRWILAVVVILVVIGVAAGIARSVYPTTLGVRAETLREGLWDAAGLHATSAQRRFDVQEVEARFAAHPWWIFLHASIGSFVLLAGSLQFVRSLRERHLRFHRWNGRVLLATGLVVAVTGMFFGVVIPAAGAREAAVIALVSILFVVSVSNGALAIRKNDKRKHREWMIRASAVVLGVATVRIVAAFADILLTPRGWSLEDVFVLSLVLGWSITGALAEVWILRTRRGGALAGSAYHRYTW